MFIYSVQDIGLAAVIALCLVVMPLAAVWDLVLRIRTSIKLKREIRRRGIP